MMHCVEYYIGLTGTQQNRLYTEVQWSIQFVKLSLVMVFNGLLP